MRVVLQEKVVQVFGDEGRHAGICQGCEEYDKYENKPKKEGGNKTLSRDSSKLFKRLELKLFTFVVEIQVKEWSTKRIQT